MAVAALAPLMGAMASAAPWLSLASAGMGLIGGMKQAAGIKAAGKAQMQEAEYRAQMGRQKAGQERASSQREAIEDRRKGRLAQSRATALTAAGGGSADDVSNIIGDLGAESEYSALTSLYQGEDAAVNLESGADLALYEGKAAYSAAKTDASSARMKAIGGAFSSMSGSTLFDKYAPTSGRGDFDRVLAGGSYR